MEGNLTAEQHAKLCEESVNRQPIGSDEILLVGDVRLGIPVLKRYFDNLERSSVMLRRALDTDCSVCAAFLAWTRTSRDESWKTLMEVQRLRELVREAESAVIAG